MITIGAMRLVVRILFAAGLAAIVLPRGAGAASPSVPACVAVTTESRWVPYGYNHVVVLKNGCSKAATCTVASDVNPEAQTAEVAPGATVEVLTFMASPQQTFTARVSCKLRP